MKDLREKREAANLTQRQVAEGSKISLCFYNQIEHEKRTPSVQTAKKIAKILKINWTDFYDDLDERTKAN